MKSNFSRNHRIAEKAGNLERRSRIRRIMKRNFFSLFCAFSHNKIFNAGIHKWWLFHIKPTTSSFGNTWRARIRGRTLYTLLAFPTLRNHVPTVKYLQRKSTSYLCINLRKRTNKNPNYSFIKKKGLKFLISINPLHI